MINGQFLFRPHLSWGMNTSSDNLLEPRMINRVRFAVWIKPLTDFPKDALAYTQRKIFSLVSSIFDPIGIMSPTTIPFKIVLQELWKLGKKWDEQIAPQVVKPLEKNLD